MLAVNTLATPATGSRRLRLAEKVFVLFQPFFCAVWSAVCGGLDLPVIAGLPFPVIAGPDPQSRWSRSRLGVRDDEKERCRVGARHDAKERCRVGVRHDAKTCFLQFTFPGRASPGYAERLLPVQVRPKSLTFPAGLPLRCVERASPVQVNRRTEVSSVCTDESSVRVIAGVTIPVIAGVTRNLADEMPGRCPA